MISFQLKTMLQRNWTIHHPISYIISCDGKFFDLQRQIMEQSKHVQEIMKSIRYELEKDHD